MKIVNVATLSGPALDWAVAKCMPKKSFVDEWDSSKENWPGRDEGDRPPGTYYRELFMPSNSWAQGGPIIERECIRVNTYDDGEVWLADMGDTAQEYGVTILEAAMRCYVASKLGNTVEIPEEVV